MGRVHGFRFRILRFSVWWRNGVSTIFLFFCFLFGQNDVVLHLPSLHFIFIETVSLILCPFGAYLTKKKNVQQDDMTVNSRN